MKSPCKDCKRRKIGCHNVEKCKDWAMYVEYKKARQDAQPIMMNWDEHNRRRRGVKPPMR